MADPILEADEAEFDGYVDSGIWMMEEYLRDWLCAENVRNMMFRDLWRDYFQH